MNSKKRDSHSEPACKHTVRWEKSLALIIKCSHCFLFEDKYTDCYWNDLDVFTILFSHIATAVECYVHFPQLTLGRARGVGGQPPLRIIRMFEKGIYSVMPKLSVAVYLSLAEILICHLCVHDFWRCHDKVITTSRFNLKSSFFVLFHHFFQFFKTT